MPRLLQTAPKEGLCAMGIMTKAPRAGAVKTRLQPPLNAAEAAAINVCFLRDISAAIAGAGRGTQGVAVYTPVGAEKIYDDFLPDDFLLLAQHGDGFGDRLVNAMNDLLGAGFSSACLINSDSPTVPAAAFAQAAAALQQPEDRIVLGPSDDGGYYLIGMRKLYRQLFAGIDWSTDRVTSQTIQRAAESGLEVELLPPFCDVDDGATLQRLCQDVLGPGQAYAPATKAFLEDVIAREGRERIWPQ